MTIPIVETFAISNQISNASSKTDVTSPNGVLGNDIVLIFIAMDGDAANPEADADGFATLTSFPEGADEIYVLWKRSSGSEPANYTVNWTGNEQARFMTVRVSGCITTGDPWDVISSGVSNSATTTNVINRLTSTVVDTLALYAVAVDRDRVDAADTITGTGWTEVGISGSSGGANGVGLIVGENDMPSIEQVEAGTFGTWASDQNASRGFNLKSSGLATVGRTFNVRHDIAEFVNRTFNIRHDIAEFVNRTFNIRHDILNLVGRTFNLRHDIVAFVGRTFNLRHDLLEVVGRTFNIRHQIAILVNRIFNVRHDIKQLVNRTFNVRHDVVLTAILTEAGEIILQEDGDALLLDISVISVGRTFNLRHDLLEFVNRTFNIRHDIAEFVSQTFNIRHDISQFVNRTFNVRHDILVLIGRTFNIRHDIFALVGRTFNLRHDLAGVIGRTFNLRHDLAGIVGREFNIRHDIKNLVNQTFNIRHDVLILVNRIFNIRHDISEFVGRTFNLRHDLAGQVGRTFDIRHDIAEFVNRTFNIRHDIVEIVNRTFNIRHDITNLIGRTFNLRHDLAGVVGRTFNLRHDIIVEAKIKTPEFGSVRTAKKRITALMSDGFNKVRILVRMRGLKREHAIRILNTIYYPWGLGTPVTVVKSLTASSENKVTIINTLEKTHSTKVDISVISVSKEGGKIKAGVILPIFNFGSQDIIIKKKAFDKGIHNIRILRHIEKQGNKMVKVKSLPEIIDEIENEG